MAVRIEDAGFEVRDIISWHFSSGFPKSHNISKAINKAAMLEGFRFIGIEREEEYFKIAERRIQEVSE